MRRSVSLLGRGVLLAVLVLLVPLMGSAQSQVDVRNILSNNDSQQTAPPDVATVSPPLPDGDFSVAATGTVDVKTILRIRKYPWGPVIGGLSNGAELKIIGVSGDFYKIEYEGGVAYVHRTYVSLEGYPSRTYPITYPYGCEQGGYISGAGGGNNSQESSDSSESSVPSSGKPSAGPDATPGSADSWKDAPTIGKRQGNGTARGAVGWAYDQTKEGTQKGVNPNNGKSSKNITAWNHFCLAFVNSAYGRKVRDLQADTAYHAYLNCKRSGRKFSKGKNPPAGAVFFTGPTSSNSAGHTFIATGENAPDGEPYILSTTGYGGFKGISKMKLSKMLSMMGKYYGWTVMP